MKSTLLKALCIILAAAGIFAILTASDVPGDVSMVKNYWLDQKEANAGNVDRIIEGIGLLAQSLDMYLDGAAQYEAGLTEYEEGKAQIEAGEDELYYGQYQYDQGTQQLAEAKLTYDDYVGQVEAGKRQLAEGKAQLEKGKEELAAGKAKLAVAMPIYELIMPIYEDYQKAQNKYNNALEIYDAAMANNNLIAASAAKLAMNSAEKDLDDLRIYMSVRLSGYTIESLIAEVEAGKAEVAAGELAVAEGEKQVAEGEAQIADAERQLAEGRVQIEQGEQQLIDGKRDLDSGYAEYWAGLQQLAEGELQLAEGDAQLKVFEDGQAQLVDGIELAMSMDGYSTERGKAVVPAIRDRLESDFSYWMLGADGKQLLARGNPVLDTDRATEVADAAKSFMSDIESETTSELISRYVFAGLTVILAAMCIAAATLAFLNNTEAAKKIARISALGMIVAAAVKYVFFPEITMSIAAGSILNGRLPHAMLILAAAAALFYASFALISEAPEKE